MKKQFWNLRTKLLLTLGLVVLPAAALIFFGFQHLESIERGHTVEAAIHGDFQRMLVIFDKRLSERAYDMMDSVSPDFPSPLDKDINEKLDAILAAHPWAAYAFAPAEAVASPYAGGRTITAVTITTVWGRADL